MITKLKRKYKKRNQRFDLKVIANKYKRELTKNKTDAEKIFEYILDKLKVEYKSQHIIYYGKSFYIVDFFFPKHKLIIEVDGKHHYTPEGLTKDVKRDKTLNKLGYKVKRFRNEEVYSPRKCERRIKEILGIKTNKYF